MNWKTLIAGSAAVSVATLITGCAPGDVVGKISGESKLRNAGSSISGFNHDNAETNNASIEVKLKAEILEPFSGVVPALNPYNLLTLNPNAVGSVNVNDKTLKFEYEGDVVYANLALSNAPAGSPVALTEAASARKGEFAGKLNPEFRARMEKTFKAVKNVDDIHREKGKKLDGVFLAVGHGRNKVSPTNAAPTCGSYFLSLTLQTSVDLPAGALDGFFTLPVVGSISGSPAIPAGSTFQTFVAVGDCGYYESIGVAEKGKIKVEVKNTLPTAPAK